MKKIDVAIIGAGTAGLSARKEVAKHTKNYLVFDGGHLGTTCARVGCMPSKVFIQKANDIYLCGAKISSQDRERIFKEVRETRERFISSVLKSFDEWAENHLVKENARFISSQVIEAGGIKYEAKKIIIATGASPRIPEEWQKFKEYFLTSDTIFDQENLPETMAVIGLGSIGVELGQALHRLGIKVYGINDGKGIANFTHPELKEYASKKLAEEFEIDFSGVKSLSVEKNSLIIHTGERKIKVDKALLAIGREPNISKLNLEKIEAPLNDKGIPKFNPKTLRIEGSEVYIAGDVNGYRPLLHEGADEGSISGCNAPEKNSDEFCRRTPLSITFCAPNAGMVGKSHDKLTESGEDFVTGTVCFEGQGRAIILGEEVGLMKVFAQKSSGKLLGAEIFAPRGEHLAHLLAWSIQLNLTVKDVLNLPVYHPTVEEGLRTALQDLDKKVDAGRSLIEKARCWDHPTSHS